MSAAVGAPRIEMIGEASRRNFDARNILCVFLRNFERSSRRLGRPKPASVRACQCLTCRLNNAIFILSRRAKKTRVGVTRQVDTPRLDTRKCFGPVMARRCAGTCRSNDARAVLLTIE
jgi:hypothetical protein